MKQKINFSFQYEDRTFNFKNINVSVGQHGVYAPMGGVSQVVRQFIKQMFPQLKKFWIRTDSFSMGDSVDVYLNSVDQDLYDSVRSTLKSLFQRGTFNGMIDMYEYNRNSGIKTEVNGHSVSFDTKWMGVENRPKYGTPEYELYWEQQEK